MRQLSMIGLVLVFLCLGRSLLGQSVADIDLWGQEAYSKNFADLYGSLKNDAVLADLEEWGIGGLIVQPFSMKELRRGTLLFHFPVGASHFGLKGSVSGFRAFKRQQIQLGYARKLSAKINLGADLHFLQFRLPEYGSSSALTFSLSTLVHLTDQWHAGFRAFNPVGIRYRKLGQEKIPALYNAGVGYQPSDVFLFTSEVYYSQKSAEALFGFHYQLVKKLSLSGGITTGEHTAFGRIKIGLKEITLLLSASFHEQLGTTPGAGFLFEKGGENE